MKILRAFFLVFCLEEFLNSEILFFRGINDQIINVIQYAWLFFNECFVNLRLEIFIAIKFIPIYLFSDIFFRVIIKILILFI